MNAKYTKAAAAVADVLTTRLEVGVESAEQWRQVAREAGELARLAETAAYEADQALTPAMVRGLVYLIDGDGKGPARSALEALRRRGLAETYTPPGGFSRDRVRRWRATQKGIEAFRAVAALPAGGGE